ncbi:MAG: response regulator, partial [Candidatus Sulfobium sp.]
RKSEPHLILLDVNMNPTDGVSVFRRLKEDEQISHIPVIFLSSVSDAEIIRTCRDMGCFDFILKPVRIRVLHGTIERCFSFRGGMSRKHLRAAFHKKVSLMHEGRQYQLFSESLSGGGIYLRKDVPLPVGSKVEVTLLLDNTPVHVTGSVIYTRELFTGSFDLPPGMAIEFKGLGRHEHQQLNDYIEKLLARDITEGRELSRHSVEHVG